MRWGKHGQTLGHEKQKRIPRFPVDLKLPVAPGGNLHWIRVHAGSRCGGAGSGKDEPSEAWNEFMKWLTSAKSYLAPAGWTDEQISRVLQEADAGDEIHSFRDWEKWRKGGGVGSFWDTPSATPIPRFPVGWKLPVERNPGRGMEWIIIRPYDE